MLTIVALACNSASPPDTETPTGSDTGTPVGPPPTSTPPDPTDTGPIAVTGLSSELHPDFGTIVVASWNQTAAADVHVEFSFDDGVWLSSPVKARAAGLQQELLLGVPYETDVTWRVVATDGATTVTSPDQAATTGTQPPPIPEGAILVNDAGQDTAGAPYWLVGLATVGWFTDPWWVVIVDRSGRVVWANRTPPDHSSMHARVARDGRSLFLDRSTVWAVFDGGAGSYVDQVKIDGSLVHTFITPGLHHPFTDLPGGSLAYGAEVGSYGNEALEIVHPDDTTETLWVCQQWLQAVGKSAYCASNTLTYDEPTDKFLFSFYSMETIVEIDGTDGSVSRWFGHLGDSYAFDPVESAFWWQHGGILTDDGTLLTSSHTTSATNEIVVREYAIDDANETLHEVWSFGVGDGRIGDVMGEAVRLPNGNTVHNTGPLGRLLEVAPDGTVVWDISWPSADLGRTMPIADLYLLAP